MSFAVYAVAVLLLHQDRSPNAVEDGNPAWAVEGPPVAAAISHVVYGSRVGSYYIAIYNYMNSGPGSRYEVVERLATGTFPIDRSQRETYVPDGNSIGYLLFATWAMVLFGPHLSSLIWAFLLVMGIGAGAFAWRFPDERLLVVPLIFTALTIMLLGQAVTLEWVQSQVPIGGSRYFTAAATLPALHLIFEVLDEPAPRWAILPRAGLMAIQTALLTLSFFVRPSCSALILTFALAGIYALWRTRRSAPRRRGILAQLGFVAAVATLATSLFIGWVSNTYARTGRLSPVFWHRAFISFSVNPKFPFPGLDKVFDCTGTPGREAGFTTQNPDGYAQCAWFSGANTGRPLGELLDEMFTPRYERFLRDAFFTVVKLYPRESLETFSLYKTQFLEMTIDDSFDFSHMTRHMSSLYAAGIEILGLVIFTLCGVMLFGTTLVRSVGLFIPIIVFSLPQYYIAWARMHTATDLISYEYIVLLAAAVAVIQFASRLVLRPAGPPLEPDRVTACRRFEQKWLDRARERLVQPVARRLRLSPDRLLRISGIVLLALIVIAGVHELALVRGWHAAAQYQ